MRNKRPRISLIVPVYNEQSNIGWHYDQMVTFLNQHNYTYELWYVDDGSTDDSLALIKDICQKDSDAHYLSFSRNFGKEAALTAGLQKATGDVIVGIDADGQYPLDALLAMITEWQAGYDIVIGVRTKNRRETVVKKLGSKAFYKFLRMLDSQQEVVSAATDFRLLDRKVVDEFNKLTERNRITRNLIDWLGFKRTYIEFEALDRHAGVATYTFGKKVKLATDGIVKHSTKPLKFIGGLGVLVALLSVVAAILLIVEKYAFGDPLNLAITGTAILALLLSFLIGIVLVCQGLLALYLENVYHETQNRPLYIIREEQ